MGGRHTRARPAKKKTYSMESGRRNRSWIRSGGTHKKPALPPIQTEVEAVQARTRSSSSSSRRRRREPVPFLESTGRSALRWSKAERALRGTREVSARPPAVTRERERKRLPIPIYRRGVAERLVVGRSRIACFQCRPSV